MGLFAKGDANYRKSNRIMAVDFDLNDNAKVLAAKILDSWSAMARQQLSQELLDELCDLACTDICNVKISNTHQYHKKSGGRTTFKQYGYYRPQSRYIYIQNLTAVQGREIAPKTFLNTLLHEWMHHYDMCKLGLNSIHTAGFYSRLKELEMGLRGVF